MRDLEKELEKSLIVAQIKNLLANVEMWQNFVLKWKGTIAQRNSNLISKNVEYAQAQVNLNLTKIKILISRFEEC